MLQLAPAELVHSNMGGLFVGRVAGLGEGLALWEAEWTSGAHYDPHPYTLRFWAYRDGSLTGPAHLKTKPLTPRPDAAPATLGLPIRSIGQFSTGD